MPLSKARGEIGYPPVTRNGDSIAAAKNPAVRGPHEEG
jgi:hypothetical protein